MSWGRLDDKLHSHRKVRKAGKRGIDRLAAMGLWALCLSYTCDHNTEGQIDLETVVDIAGSEALATRLAAQLVAAGFWSPTDSGWSFHDWRQYNRDNQTRAALSELRAEAGRRGGLARSKSIVAVTSTSHVQAEVKQVATELLKQNQAPDPGPARPDPKEEEKTPPADAVVLVSPVPKRASRRVSTKVPCPPDWKPSAQTLAVLSDEGIAPTVAVAIVREFVEYWTEGAGAGKKQANWDIVFRSRARTLQNHDRLPRPVPLPRKSLDTVDDDPGPFGPPPPGALDDLKDLTVGTFIHEPGADVKWTPKPKPQEPKQEPTP